MTRLRLIAASALALALVLPSTALAASYEIGGTVTDPQGGAVAGAEVAILVQGTDVILSATTDASGGWAIQLDADPGAVLEINGTGPAVTTGPDEDGCTTTTTGSGQVQVTLPAEGTPDAVTLVLADELTGTVCAATPTPPNTGGSGSGKGDSDKPVTARVTPPSTDTLAAPVAGEPNGSLLVLLGLLGVLSAGTLVLTTVAAPSRRRR